MSQATLTASELRYRRLFEAAHDGILILDPQTRRIIDVNPFLVQLTGYPQEDFIGRELFEIGLLKDEAASQAAFRELRAVGRIRYEDLPLQTKDGRSVAVEFVSNLYQEGDHQVIQCNIRDITARKHTEEELAWKTALLEAKVNSSLDGILIVSPHGRKILQNPRLAGLFDLPRQLVDDPDEQKLMQGISAAMRDPEAFRERVRQMEAHPAASSQDEMELMDGRVLDRYSAPVLGNDGRHYGRIWGFRDITGRKQAEATLRESEQRFAGAFEFAPIGVALVTPAGRWLRVNRAICALLGYTEAELLNRTIQEITHPDDLAADRAAGRGLLAGERSSYEMEKRYVHRDGHPVTVLLSVSLVQDGLGQPRYFIAHVQDISARKRMELALRESNEMFRQLADNITDAFWIRSPDLSEVQYVSPAFERIWGRSVASLRAQPARWVEFILPADRGRVLAAFAALTDATPTLDIEYRITRPDGEVRWVRVRGFQVRDSAEKLIRHIGIVSDITERRRHDEHLLQSRKMEALGQFSGGVAHDFNNILAAIGGYAELSRLIAADHPEIRRHLDAILAATHRAADLVRQILAFSREQTQERRVVSLAPVVTECIKLLRVTLPATIEFGVRLADDAPAVLANVNQVHQMMMNLGINAGHAMAERTGRLEIDLERCVVDAAQAAAQPQLPPGRYARVSVRDTGCGMDAATLPRIFEPFFTAKQPGQGTGTGLGLAVVHGLMHGHDGVVTVQSTPGVGTVFHLYFPETAEVVNLVPPKDRTLLVGRGERILVVDDEEIVASMTQEVLVALGYEADVENLPGTALARVRTEPSRYALVLTDQSMPGMSGTTLAGQLQLIRADLPIILMTGYNGALTAERINGLGIRELLLKPTSIEVLGAAVHEALARPARV